jgi:hypothetical protein
VVVTDDLRWTPGVNPFASFHHGSRAKLGAVHVNVTARAEMKQAPLRAPEFLSAVFYLQ